MPYIEPAHKDGEFLIVNTCNSCEAEPLGAIYYPPSCLPIQDFSSHFQSTILFKEIGKLT